MARMSRDEREFRRIARMFGRLACHAAKYAAEYPPDHEISIMYERHAGNAARRAAHYALASREARAHAPR